MTVSRRVPPSFLTPILVPTVFSVFTSKSIPINKSPLFLLVPMHLPKEEFDIICPDPEREPYREGGRTEDCSERPNIRGGSDHGFAHNRH